MNIICIKDFILFSIIEILRVCHLPLQFILNSWNFKCHKMSIIELERSFTLNIDIRSSIKLDEKKTNGGADKFICRSQKLCIEKYDVATIWCLFRINFHLSYCCILYICTHSNIWIKAKVTLGKNKSSLPTRQLLPNAIRLGILRALILSFVRVIVLVVHKKHTMT